jgi:phage shock protein A
MGLLKRIWDFLRGKAHTAMDKVENKVESAELSIRDLEAAHQKSIEALASSRTICIKLKSEAKKATESAESYLSKALKLKARLGGDDDEQVKKDIVTMLNRQENFKKEAEEKTKKAEIQDAKTDKMADSIKKLQTTIGDAKTNIANQKVDMELAAQNKNISKELSDLNVDGITGKLAAIQTQIDNDTNEAEAWGGIDEDLESDEARIDRMLNESSATDDNELLNSFLTKDEATK